MWKIDVELGLETGNCYKLLQSAPWVARCFALERSKQRAEYLHLQWPPESECGNLIHRISSCENLKTFQISAPSPDKYETSAVGCLSAVHPSVLPT